MTYKKKYINPNNDYVIIQIYDNGYEREVQESKQSYMELLLLGNIPEEIQYVYQELPIDEIYKSKIEEIEYEYNETFKLGLDISIGIKVKCEIMDQLRWADNLLILMTYNIQSTDVQDFYDNIHTITIDQYKQLCLEIAGYVKYLAGKRWVLINQANIALENDDIDTLKGIIWQ